jgi:signal transduction histidine kinase
MPFADAAHRHDRHHLTAVRDIATAVGARLDFPSVLAAIIERVCALLDCERASLFVIDEDGGIASLVMVGDSPPIRLPPREGIAGAVAADRRSLRIDDAWQDPRFHRANDERTGFRTTSLLAVPLIEGGIVKGVVEALNKNGGAAFDDDDEALLEAISDEIALAVERARTFEEQQHQKAILDRRVQELDLLVELDRALVVADGVGEALWIITRRVQELVSSDGASIALVDDRTSALIYRAAAGLGHDQLLGRAIATDTGLAGVCLETHLPVRVADAVSDARHVHMASMSTSLCTGPLLSVPLVASVNGVERVFGVLTAVRARGLPLPAPCGAQPFSADDERLMLLLASRLAIAVLDQERREKAREKQQLEAMGRMLAGIVHDFKTPMTVISGYVQLMATEDNAVEREAHAEVVLRSTDQMSTMIKELMSFARGDGSTVLVRKVWLETFAHELQTVLLSMVPDPDGPELVFSSSLSGHARFDAVKVQRAVVNLVTNAKEALQQTPGKTPGKRGTISVSLSIAPRGERDDLVIVVEDNGPGLAPEIEDRLFQSFASFGKDGGTGLGLALVKRIAEDHHGAVTVESSPGGGCRFTMHLPRS